MDVQEIKNLTLDLLSGYDDIEELFKKMLDLKPLLLQVDKLTGEEMSGLEKRIPALQSEIENLKSELVPLQAQRETFLTEIEALRDEKTQTRARLDRELKQETDSLKKAHDQSMKALQKTFEDQQESLKRQAKYEAESFERMKDEYTSILSTLQVEIREARDLRNQLTTLRD